MADRCWLAAAVAVFLTLTGQPLRGQSALERLASQIQHQVQQTRATAAEATDGAPAGATAEPGYFGLIVDHHDGADGGIEVLQVHRGGPADQAGLETGDRIDAIDGRPIRTMDDLQQTVRTAHPGDRLRLSVRRNGQLRQITVTLGRRPARSQRLVPRFGKIPEPAGRGPVDARDRADHHATPLGVRLTPLTESLRRQLHVPGAGGALVASVRQGSPADQAGISPGSVILSVAGRPLESLEHAQRAFAAVAKQQVVAVTFFDHGDLVQAQLRRKEGNRETRQEEKAADRSAAAPADPLRSPDSPPSNRSADLLRTLRARIDALQRRVDALERRERAEAGKR